MILNPLSPEDREGPVNTAQQAFCEQIILGVTQVSAYQAAYPGTSDESAMASSSRLLKYVKIQTEIARLRQRAEELAGSKVMTLVQTLEYLSAVVRTPIGQLTPDDPLTQDWREEHNAFGLKKRVKACDKLRAIETLSRLLGRFNEKVSVTGHVVTVVIGD